MASNPALSIIGAQSASQYHKAVDVGLTFNDEYPDRIGFHHGVVYLLEVNVDSAQNVHCNAYRTKGGAIVVKVLVPHG